jgi:membrane protein implicated in regulation of membrane protease activity
MDNNENVSDIYSLITDEILSILQDKRTALKIIRLGISLITLLIGAGFYLIAVYKKSALLQAGHLTGALIVAGMILLAVAIYLVVSHLVRIRRLNKEILKLKQRQSELANPRD